MVRRSSVLVPIAAAIALVVGGCSGEGESGDGGSGDGGAATTVAVVGEGTTEPATDASGEVTPVVAEAGEATPMGTPPEGDTATYNIAQIAAGTAATQTVTRLAIQAGLVGTLATGGPFTVFAPSDEAFAAVDPAALRNLSADPTALAGVLTLHVVPGTYTTADLRAANGTSLTTVQGGALRVEAKGDAVYVGGAKVAVPDVTASNGVVHVVDTVILEPNG